MPDNTFHIPFTEYMKQEVALSEATIALVAQHCQEVSLPRNHLLLKETEVCKYVYFMVEGSARSFYTDYNGKTTTWLFHFNEKEANVKNRFAVDYKSFLTATPASLSIETLTPVKAIRFSRENVDALIKQDPVFERWMRRNDEQSFVVLYDRTFALLTMTATARYHKLLKEEPHLLEMFSNYYIASYLGVTPQSLSRIRTAISNG